MDEDKKAGEAAVVEKKEGDEGAKVTEAPPKPADDKKDDAAGGKEETAGQILENANPQGQKKEDEPRLVPESALIDLKKENKQLRKDFNDLAKRIEQGASNVEISDDLKALAEEYEIQPEFLSKLQKALTAGVDRKAQEALAPIEERERQKRLDDAFNGAFAKAIAKLPELKDVVNPEVIKVLSLDPKNKDKTFVQIIEDTYGSAIPGKRTIEGTSPGGGKEPQPLDYFRAKKDPAYFDEVMSDPKLKAEYNKRMLEEGF